MTHTIEHEENPRGGTFTIGDDAKMDYRRPREDVMDVHHTYVDPAHRGKGLAQDLFHDMVRFARAEDRQVIPTCSFVASMFERHPENADVLLENRVE